MSGAAHTSAARPNTHWHRTVAGVGTVEFLLVAFTALLPLTLLTVQVALLVSAKQVINLAAFSATRAAALEHGSTQSLRREFARAVVPLYLASSPSNAVEVAGAQARAMADLLRPGIFRVRILNPTPQSFADFEVQGEDAREIPSVESQRRNPVGPQSQQSLADANVLKLQLSYCHRLVIPIADRLLVGALRFADRDPGNQFCYAANRLPLFTQVVMPMHSTPRRAALGL
jgi:hypothetical protein